MKNKNTLIGITIAIAILATATSLFSFVKMSHVSYDIPKLYRCDKSHIEQHSTWSMGGGVLIPSTQPVLVCEQWVEIPQ